MGAGVNSVRLRITQAFRCTSYDGIYLAFGADTNFPRLLASMNELHARPTLVSLTTVIGAPPRPALFSK